MFELEFAKLVDCKNEIDDETISKPTAKTIKKKVLKWRQKYVLASNNSDKDSTKIPLQISGC